MKLFIAGLGTETNSFSPIPTGRLAFEDAILSRSPTEDDPNFFSVPLIEWRRRAEERGWEVDESLCAFAQPAGTTIRATYEAFRDEILADLGKSGADVALINLHGAMIAEGYDDCEGDLLARARGIVGPDAVIGAEIDLHNHLTDAMLEAADVIVGYKEYPHTDIKDRAGELFELAADAAEGRIKPVMRDFDCRMVAMFHTSREPMRGFVDDMAAREGRDGVLSLSLSHGFPWGDCARVGARMLAITDGDAALAAGVAEEFGRRLWDERAAFLPDWPTIDGALDRVEAAKAGPLVLADFADNAGAGAPADSTFVLRAVLERGMRDVALGLFWDPVLVRMCRDVGEGGRMRVRIGGKVDPSSGDPVDLEVVVRGVKDDMKQFLGDAPVELGTGVWLEADGVHMVAIERRMQALHPVAFEDLGLELAKMRAVVVKSSQHFHAGFAPIAAEVLYINGPGAVTPDYAAIPFTKRDPGYWPRVDDPWS